MYNVRKHVYYRGNVQGVGFRYTAVRAAANHRVSGYVRNLRDGRVEVVVEGPAGEVRAFLAELAERMKGYIIDISEREEPFTGEFESFDIRF